MFFLNLQQHSHFIKFPSKANPTQSLKSSKFTTKCINKQENIKWGVNEGFCNFQFFINYLFLSQRATKLLTKQTGKRVMKKQTNPIAAFETKRQRKHAFEITFSLLQNSLKTVKCSVFDQNKGKGQL